MSNIITPTVGRKVWYRPSKFDLTGPVAMVIAGPQDDPATGRALDAVGKVWELEGYALRERLAAAPNPAEVIAREFIAENRVSCAEATINDNVYENAPELVEKLAGVVGFYRDPEGSEA